MLRIFVPAAALLTALFTAVPAEAYIGPGAGLPVIGSILAILATIIVAVGAIIMWPIRKMMKKKKAEAEAESS